MKLIIAILGGLIFIALMAITVAVQPETALAAGGPHPDYSAMAIGGDGKTRSNAILTAIFLWQCAVIAVATLLVILGVSPRRRSKTVFAGAGVVGALMLFVWASLMFAYRQYLDTGETAYVFGFPVASAWMVFGVWLSQTGFAVLYVYGFRKFIFTAEDESEFEAVVAEYKSTKNNTATQ